MRVSRQEVLSFSILQFHVGFWCLRRVAEAGSRRQQIKKCTVESLQVYMGQYRNRELFHVLRIVSLLPINL
ncbi:MAG: hypothetical protein Q6368_007310 [Candidatus Baldrarchaeota archaeon]